MLEVESAAKLVRLFLREKDEELAKQWPKRRLKEYIEAKLKQAGQDTSYISKENLLRLQQGFGPMFRGLDQSHPRMSQAAQEVCTVDLSEIRSQSFSESALKEDGALYIVRDDASPFDGHEVHLWEQYKKFKRMYAEYKEDASEPAKAIATRIHEIDRSSYKLPWNVHYVTHRPEIQFSELLFANSNLFDAFAKMPNVGGYSFPYSYKPAKSAKTHVANESFNPDFFLKVAGANDTLVVEIKADGDDSNRNRAKCRDGLKHFETLNQRLVQAKEKCQYHFYFLSPDDYTKFFERVREKTYAGWRSSLMQDLLKA
jgi:type III restriction enzyme